jgi:dTDP-4-dehydrorhamnose reductase
MTETRPSVLIVGGDGFIGKSLTRKLQTAGWSVFSTTRRPELVSSTRPYLDLLRPELIVGANTLGKVNHAIICGGITSIARCEEDPIGTHIINVDGVTHLAQRIMEVGINLIFLSSSAVFGGSLESPLPLDRPTPDCEYGRQKLLTEQNLTAFGEPVKIIRLTKVINPTDTIFRTWVHKLKSGTEIAAFDDVHVAPISIGYCTSFIIKLLSTNRDGVFHAAPKYPLTYFEIAHYMCRTLGCKANLVKPIKNGEHGVYATKGAHLGGVINEDQLPPQPGPLETIDNLLYLFGESNV